MTLFVRLSSSTKATRNAWTPAATSSITPKLATANIIIFNGDEPHLDIERYADAVLDAAEQLNVTRIVGVAGVFRSPIRQRAPRGMYYQPARHARRTPRVRRGYVQLRRRGQRRLVHLPPRHRPQAGVCRLLRLRPAYDFGQLSNASGFRIENDFRAWAGLMRRIKHMIELDFDIGDLESKTDDLDRSMEEKIVGDGRAISRCGIRRYFDGLEDGFEEVLFDPLSDVWEDRNQPPV